MKAKFDFRADNSRNLTVFDPAYGYGYFFLGECAHVPSVGFLDYGLGKETGKIVEAVFASEYRLDALVEGHEKAERNVVYTARTAPIDRLFQTLLREDFSSEDPLARGFLRRGLVESAPLIPVSEHNILLEEVERHFRTKVESVLHCAQESGALYQFSAFSTTDPKTKFLLARVRLTEKADKKKCKAKKAKMKEWFERLVPGVRLVKLFVEGNEFECGFCPTAEQVRKIMLQEAPRFPNDPIDGYQAVVFETGSFLNEATLSVIKRKLLEAGAAVDCWRTPGDTKIEVLVPCSYSYGGTRGKAFEGRLNYILYVLQEDTATTINEYTMGRRRHLHECAPAPLSQKGSIQETAPKLAFTRALLRVPERELPVLFEKYRRQEIFMECTQGNFLIARKDRDSVVISQGVATGATPQNVLDYYPDLLAAGKG